MKIKCLVLSIICLLVGLLAGWLICYFTPAGPVIVLSPDLRKNSVWVKPGGTLEFTSQSEFYVVENDIGKTNRGCREPDAQLHGKAGDRVLCHINLNADVGYEFDVFATPGQKVSSTAQPVNAPVNATVQPCHPLCPKLLSPSN